VPLVEADFERTRLTLQAKAERGELDGDAGKYAYRILESIRQGQSTSAIADEEPWFDEEGDATSEEQAA
jgi:hypothetical protein